MYNQSPSIKVLRCVIFYDKKLGIGLVGQFRVYASIAESFYYVNYGSLNYDVKNLSNNLGNENIKMCVITEIIFQI